MMPEKLCVDPHLMALNLMRCACREACHGCNYDTYGKVCEDRQLNDSCIDRMMREAALMLDPQVVKVMSSLEKRDDRERREDAKTEERDY